MTPARLSAAALLLVPSLLACSRASGPAEWFVETARESGLDFVHVHGGSGERYMVETMGAGGGFLDFDNDGWLDVYLIQSGPLPGYADPTALPNRLFRNRGDGSFEDVTAQSGAGDTGYGMGVCFGDVDNDGFVDIHVTNFGPDRLLRNDGDGSFSDVTAQAGIDNPDWGASCAFADYDRDGCLDLYVANYVDFQLGNHRRCGSAELPVYCHPDVYLGVPDRLYRNRCDGTFEELTERAGVRNADPQESKGLGVIWTDYDDDGDADLYVANDSTRNFLYRNEGDGTFRDVAVLAGAAYDELGWTEAGMGVDAGDHDGDGRIDLFVTNLDFETNTLYRNLGGGQFLDSTALAGLAAPSLMQVGFGTNLADFDNDGDLDLFVANGHILDNVRQQNASLRYEQPNQLFENVGGGRFVEVSARAGSYFRRAGVSRGSAAGDVDNDGDLDLLVTNNNAHVELLRNESAPGRGWIALRLISRYGGRDAIGARVRLVAGGRERIGEVRGASSYLSQGDPRVHFGLGELDEVERVEIVWPEGERQSLRGGELRLGAVNLIRQPREGA
jgi:hypothetical protein